MAPIVKIMSQSKFIYEKNNFVALVNKGIPTSEDYHKMMDFVKGCKLNYAMLESPTIYYEVMEEMWTTVVYQDNDKTITLSIKGKEHCINCDIIKACFNFPDNTTTNPHTDDDIVNLFNSMAMPPTTKLSEIRRLGLRKEWSFFCDVVTKVFSGKVSNFDSANTIMLNMLYMLLTDKYFNFSDAVMFELGYKLGEVNKRSKHIYYARFLMIISNHICEDLVIENPTNKLDFWVQERRVIVNLNSVDHHKEVPLVYFPIMEGLQVSEVSTIVPTIPTSQIYLPLSMAMASVSMTKQMPTQVTKIKNLKTKSKKIHSGFSQMKPVVKSTKHQERSVKVSELGEGQGEHQRSPKDKVGEEKLVQEAVDTLLDNGIRGQPMRDDHNKVYKSFSDFDVVPINVESQPKSLIIEAPQTPNSPKNSLDVHMINTSIPDSPSLTLLGMPKSSASEHHILDDLLAHLLILSGTTKTYVPKFSSICTESTIISTPNSIISSIPVDIVYPSVSDCIPTDVPNSSHPSAIITTTPMDISHPSILTTHAKMSTIVTSVDELVVVQSLLGLREGSEMSERLGCSQEKGEERNELMHAISSSLEKESEMSSTLEGEAMPNKVDDDVDYKTGETEDFFGDEDGDGEEFMDIGGEAGPSSRSNILPWVFYKECD
ncbi:hypothetical protein AgCh_028948 [Apium graveolens]